MQRFIAWGKANYPARHYGLLIYSHANGQSMCPVERTGDEMGIAELTDKIGVTDRVDFLALELCNMGGAEIAYQWRPGTGRFEADVLLAIPNAGPPLDWDRAFNRIRSPGHASIGGPALDPSKMTPEDFATERTMVTGLSFLIRGSMWPIIRAVSTDTGHNEMAG